MMLARQGAHVIVNYNSSDADARQTVTEAQSLGVDALALQCDVSNLEAVQAMADQIEERFGGVDVIVNGASYFGKIAVPTDDIATWQRTTRVSIDGTFYVCNRLVPGMQERGGGAIVNIIDLSVWEPWRHFTAHAVGKSGMLALTRQLALELAPDIRVNAVAPGPVLPPPGFSEKKIARRAKQTLLQRWGTPEDVARAVRYLIEAEYVTGDVLTVDGGERYCQ